MINPLNLTGRTIIVTGASSGIGRETAIHISRLGGKVILVARNTQRLHETMTRLNGEGHSSYSFDLQQLSGIEPLLQLIVSESGLISGLAYCAGIGNTYPVSMTRTDRLMKVMNVNTFGFVEMVRILSSERFRTCEASFVGVSSVAALKGEKGMLAYCMSKGALNSGMRAMARELGVSGVRVNVVLPGWIKTEMYEDVVDSYGSSKFDREMASLQYLGLGAPLDIANAIVFLLSNASRFISGIEMPVDGGYLS